MGGDHGPQVVVAAAVAAYREYPALRQILVGDQDAIRAEFAKHRVSEDERLAVRHASEVVGMDESPSKALRNKKDSSMRVAINLVKDGLADAVVSSGNTGALMATARFVLKTIPGIDRPAIISAMPTIRGRTYMLDLGANAECTPEQLYQFAVMGAVMSESVDNIADPRVALLNIGEEEVKGVDTIRSAAQLLQHSNLNYVGFVEGNRVFSGDTDVVVCDGFSGNVALKSSEGLATMMAHFIRAEFKRNWLTRAAGLIAYPVLKAIGRRLDPRLYNGASLVGLQGIVIKSHGGADALAFGNAIRIAVVEVEKAVPQKIGRLVASALTEQQVGEG